MNKRKVLPLATEAYPVPSHKPIWKGVVEKAVTTTAWVCVLGLGVLIAGALVAANIWLWSWILETLQ